MVFGELFEYGITGGTNCSCNNLLKLLFYDLSRSWDRSLFLSGRFLLLALWGWFRGELSGLSVGLSATAGRP